MASWLQYRDPETGQFISRRSAAQRAEVTTEKYSTDAGLLESDDTYRRSRRDFDTEVVAEQLLAAGADPDFVDEVLAMNPDLSLVEALVAFEDHLSFDFFELDFDGQRLNFLVDVDQDFDTYEED